jgi:hypothetical protein
MFTVVASSRGRFEQIPLKSDEADALHTVVEVLVSVASVDQDPERDARQAADRLMDFYPDMMSGACHSASVPFEGGRVSVARS